MRIAALGLIVVALLAVAGPARAGCWATVGLAPPPATLAAGDVWAAEITVLQHGQYPLPDAAGAKPTLTIANADTGQRKTFTARAKDPQAGTYTARVVFPAGGRWSYEVYDGFDRWDGEPAPCAQTHTFGAVEIGGSSGSSASSGSDGSGPGAASARTGDSGGFPAWPVGGGVAGALLAALAVGLALRRRGPRPAST